MAPQLNRNELIWQVVNAIPAGKVATYGQVARLAGLPGFARYVGHVLRNLPQGSCLPWHRVINAQGRLSLPEGSDSWHHQRRLLEQEGITFNEGRLLLSRYGWCEG